MPNPHTPYHPIIYVRGFAGSQGEIDETVADPYMGFNVGSTKARQYWDGSIRRFYFESPVVRLKDEVVYDKRSGTLTPTPARYDDVYVDGEDLTAPHPDDANRPLRTDITLPYQSIVILRYYDIASTDFGDPKAPHPIEDFARQLNALIYWLRAQVCRRGGRHPLFRDQVVDNGVAEDEFKVYLVAHSMGGLVCRAFLQGRGLGDKATRSAVDKMFTYATPHNGIDLRVVRNVPGWAALLGDATNFNRDRMAEYLGLPIGTTDVSDVGDFDPERIFNLVGTNPADYLVAKGLSSWAVGERSDGLVRMENATTFGKRVTRRATYRIDSPRAFVNRSHSGQYGIVNSEEGYQNLTRFLFGTVRVDGYFDVTDVTLPEEIQLEYTKDPEAVRASYRFEVVAALRGTQWQLHRRTIRENSDIQRKYDDLFPRQPDGKRAPSTENSPHLFSLFLDPAKSQREDGSVAFTFDLAVMVPDYEVHGVLWMKRHFEGSYLVRKLLLVEARPSPVAPAGWEIFWGDQSETPNSTPNLANSVSIAPGVLGFEIEVSTPAATNPRLQGKLRIELRNWS